MLIQPSSTDERIQPRIELKSMHDVVTIVTITPYVVFFYQQRKEHAVCSFTFKKIFLDTLYLILARCARKDYIVVWISVSLKAPSEPFEIHTAY